MPPFAFPLRILWQPESCSIKGNSITLMFDRNWSLYEKTNFLWANLCPFFTDATEIRKVLNQGRLNHTESSFAHFVCMTARKKRFTSLMWEMVLQFFVRPELTFSETVLALMLVFSGKSASRAQSCPPTLSHDIQKLDWLTKNRWSESFFGGVVFFSVQDWKVGNL